MSLKRALYLTHRWLGVGMCLLFALWFTTGVIMMYVEYPELTENERLANLPVLAIPDVAISAGQAAAIAGTDATEIRLSSVAGRPAYLIRDNDGDLHTIFADDGSSLRSLSRDQALATVRYSGFAAADSRPEHAGVIVDDQWTVSSVLDEHRPLHRVLLGDAAGTILYVSSRTGQIVRDTHRSERFWNWLGSTIHWIYPVQLRRHSGLWTQLLIYLSLIGVISVLTGGIVGLLRLRLINRYRGNRITPYRGAGKWHHLLGLACYVFIATFIFSGLMSMSPWGIFDSSAAEAPQIERYMGGTTLDLDRAPLPEPALLPPGIREIEWLQIAGTGHLSVSRTASDKLLIDASRGSPSEQRAALEQRIRDAIPAMLPDASLASLEILTEYDNYYYSRHNRYFPLPAIRARFSDDESTWYHIDLNTGKVVSRLTDASRLARWLYNGLHSLDFRALTSRGIAWDLTVIALCIIGTAFSISAVVIGWRRLIFPTRRRPRLRHATELRGT